MKTSNYLIALAALTSFTFVSCSDNDFLGSASNIFSGGKEEITFGSGTKNLTRAGENLQHAKAAEKLNNHFVLYGFKYNPSELAAVTNDELVFDHYNLYYKEGTENTTESNTAGWEYVGYQTTASQDQSIKYWDHSAAGYVFSAISSLDATATKITGATTTKYDKGWTVSIPAGGTLNGLYASDRVEKLLASDYDKEVMLTFYSVVTKVRFAFYEIIPGYKVHIDKFYYGTSSETETNFAINGNFRGLNPTEDTELTVTYYDEDDVDGIVNRPKITYTDDDVNQETSKTFGTNIQATAAIGTSSPEATYDQYGGEYTCILPYKSGNLSLKVDYTLTSIDGSGETIEVKGATAVVPDIYTKWKENFAYTYLFKISDNSNGYTGSDGVRGLYPITFDACVINEEDGIQETITSIAEPSFTTYQNGVIVTENDEYIQGTGVNDAIYYTVMLDGAAQALNANTKVYEVNNYGTETLTENVVENWKNNYCVLTEVTPEVAATIPMKNGAKLTPATNTAYYFTPKAGKNYVIQYHVTTPVEYTLDEYKAVTGNDEATAVPAGEYKVKAGDYYKLIRVVGDPAPITYTLTAATASENITTQTGTTTYTLKSTSPAADAAVLGAADIIKITNSADKDVTAKFDITDNEDGTYTIKATADAIKEGLDDTYSVAVVKKDGTIGATATLATATNKFAVDMASSLAATVVAGNKVDITPEIGEAGVSGAAITDISSNKITIVESATPGTYVISAASDLAAGSYTAKIAGETVTITVNSYAFDPTSYTFDWYEGVDASAINHAISLKMNGSNAAIEPTSINPTVTGIVAIANQGGATNGNYVLTPSAGGKTTLKFENATLDVTVNKYALVCEGAATADSKQITALTGSAKLIYTLNDKEQVVKTGNITVTYSEDNSTYGSATAKTYSLVNNGKYFTFGNVVDKGYYKFEYKADDGTTVLGSEIIQVK